MRKKIVLDSNSNARTTRIFLLVLIIGYLFFFTSNATIPDKITSKEDTTKVGSVDEYMDGRTCELLSATYDKDQQTMEVIVHLTNSTYDGVDSYYIAETLNNGSNTNLVTNEVLDDPLMTVIRISNLKPHYREMKLMIAPKLASISKIKDSQTAFITLNKYNVKNAPIDLTKTKQDYLIERLQTVLDSYQKKFNSLMKEDNNLEEKIENATKQNEQLEKNKLYMSSKEIDDANNTISENEQTIKQLQDQRTATRNEMQSYSNLIVKTKARLSDLQNK
jgi:hypothetical protein